MKITKMVVDEKNKNKIHIFVDETPFVVLEAELVFKLHLKLGKELSLELLDQLQAEQQFNECFNKALNIISRSLKTKKQLKDYLNQKGFKFQTINLVLEKLESLDLINDDNYCKKYIEQEKNKKGKLMLSKSLMSKGISKDIVDKYICNLDSQKDTIIRLIEKYMKNKEKNIQNIQKLKRYLLGKGFSYNEINSCVGELYESWD